MKIDPGMFPDVADALGIDSPAIVEKDVYAVQLLNLLSTLHSEAFELVFAGGTSLAKAHHKLFRMSEDPSATSWRLTRPACALHCLISMISCNDVYRSSKTLMGQPG